MFETGLKHAFRRGPAFWLTAAFCAAALLFVLNIFRVNRPTDHAPSTPTFVPEHFEGTIANERAVIPRGEVLPYRVNFNYRATVKGQFRVERDNPRILFLILDAKNYELWLSGAEFTSYVSTGKVPSGRVSRILEAGVYYLIFDNRGSQINAVVNIELTAE